MANQNNQRINDFFINFQTRVNTAISELPPIVGNVVINNVLDNFKNQSFDGQPWDRRKYKSKRGAGNQKILIQSGALRRSIRIIRTTASSITVGSDLPYASVHNDGLQINRKARSETFIRSRYKKGKRKGKFAKGTTSGQGLTFKAYSYKMTRRQFLGRNATLNAAINKTVKKHILNALKG